MKITRRELYERVWSTPMTKLSKEFGLSDSGLAKVCARHAIPCPERGYWAKVSAGLAVRKTPLPRIPVGIDDVVDVRPTGQGLIKAMAVHKEQKMRSKDLDVPALSDAMIGLHPVVSAWVSEHKQAQKNRLAEVKASRRDDWFKPEPLPDLTDRDKYRFRLTSALLKGLQDAGGKVIDGEIRGELTVQCEGQEIKLTVIEKMRQDFAQKHRKGPAWTAYPEHHNAALGPTGYLRFSVTTYFGGGFKKEWVETAKLKAPDLLVDVIAGLQAIGSALIILEREREAAFRDAEARRYAEEERRAKAQAEEARWKNFRHLADDWEQVKKLRAFLDELEAQLDTLREEIDGLRRDEWLEWARARIDALDPLSSNRKDE